MLNAQVALENQKDRLGDQKMNRKRKIARKYFEFKERQKAAEAVKNLPKDNKEKKEN